MTAIQTQAEGEVAERFDHLTDRMGMRDYNFEHFRTKHLLADAVATWEHKGIRPGEPAPDFELQLVDGSSVRLADLRNWPVLLHFGSFT